MEGFYDFKLEYSETNFPTAVDLKEIKQMLLTGDREQILQSVEKIKTFLNNEEALSEILKSDISEFLCDAVLPFDSVIMYNLYNCIGLLARHVEFYSHNHSCFAIESIMRTLHFIMKDSGFLNSLNQCLQLLNFIMQSYNTHNIIPETKTVENLLQLFPSLLKNLSPTVHNKYQIGVLILTLTDLNILKWSQEVSETILNGLSSWFNLLNEILESEDPMKEQLILLCAKLCHSVLRYLLSDKNCVEEFNFEINETLKNDIIKNINEFLISVGAPYFASLSLSKIENDSFHLENFYQSILWFYGSDVMPVKTRLIHGLSENGFLQFTTRIISFADSSQGQKLRKLCMLVLFYMILYLSEDLFHFPEVWPRGREDFRSEVQHGIAQLPVDAKQWLDELVNPQTSSSCKLSLLLYLYFYSMTAKSQDMLQAIYPAIVTFIRLNNIIESSVLLLKIVWFVFVVGIYLRFTSNRHFVHSSCSAMSQLSILQSGSMESELEITNEMISLLEAQGDLSLVYTHHPALLYWAFSSKVSSSFQTQIVHLWLRNKTPDCKELDVLMRKSCDVRFAILDVLQNGWGEELDSAFSSLKSLLMDSDDEDVASNMWFLLPRVLAKFTADSTSVMNVDYLIELCNLRTPKCLDISRLIRIASLLPEVLLKSDLISIVPSLSLILQLVQLGLHMDDYRVLRVFLGQDEFVQKILKGLNAKISDISILSIKIITILWKECKEIQNSENRRKIELNKENFLKMFETDSDHVLLVALDFLQEVLLSDFWSPIFVIKGFNVGFVETLFLEIQNVCVKTSSNISKLCWRCLKLFLTCELLRDESIQFELATHPLLHELILFNLPHLKDSQELKEFLTAWVDFYKLDDPCFDRKIFGGLYFETMQRVETKLVENYRPEDHTLFEKVEPLWHENMEENAFDYKLVRRKIINLI